MLGIEKIYYINRKVDTDRNEHMIFQLERLGIPYERIDAAINEKFENNYLHNILLDSISKNPNKSYKHKTITNQSMSEVACGLSHSMAWSKSLRDYQKFGVKKVLILEDDIVFGEKIFDSEYMSKIEKYLPTNNNITYLNYLDFVSDCGTELTKNGYYIDVREFNKFWNITYGGLFSTSAYIINLETIGERIYNIIDTMNNGVIVDNYFSTELQNSLNCYFIDKLITCDDKFNSTIGDNYTGIKKSYNTNSIYKYLDESFFGVNKYEKFYEKTEREYLTIKIEYGETFLNDDILLNNEQKKCLMSINKEMLDKHFYDNKIKVNVSIFKTTYSNDTMIESPNHGIKTKIYDYKSESPLTNLSKFTKTDYDFSDLGFLDFDLIFNKIFNKTF